MKFLRHNTPLDLLLNGERVDAMARTLHGCSSPPGLAFWGGDAVHTRTSPPGHELTEHADALWRIVHRC